MILKLATLKPFRAHVPRFTFSPLHLKLDIFVFRVVPFYMPLFMYLDSHEETVPFFILMVQESFVTFINPNPVETAPEIVPFITNCTTHLLSSTYQD